MANKASLHEVQSKALQTAQRFVDYESYQGSETRAVAALKRRCPGWSKDQCREWFDQAVVVHEAGIAFMKIHQSEAFAIYRDDSEKTDLDPIADRFVAAHARFPRDLLVGVLQWCFYWYHLR